MMVPNMPYNTPLPPPVPPNRQPPKETSWALVIVLLVVFWPVGLFFLFKKINEGNVQKRDGKGFRIAAYVLFGLGGLYLLLTLFSDSTMFAAVPVCAGIGVWLLFEAKQRDRLFEKYTRYTVLLAAGERTLDGLAAAYPTTYMQVVTDMQTLISKKYFINTYLDMNRRMVVVAEQPQAVPPLYTPYTPPATAVPAPAVPKAVRCRSCGATNTIIPGKMAVCEYCGSPLE